MRSYSLPALLLAASVLSGCTMAPAYVRPALPVSQAWPVGAPATAAASASAGPIATDLAWRDVFTDPRLQAVIDLALKQNRDLRVAVANIERARAQYRVQRAALLPAINAVVSEAKTHTPISISPTGNSYTLDDYAGNLAVSGYEFDLFGRVRSLTQAASQNFFAVEENRRSAQISLIATVAADYLTLAADQDLLAVTQDTLKTREDGLGLAQKRFEAGATSELDLRQQQTLAEQTRSDLAVAIARVAQDRDALTLVVGADVPANVLPNGDLAGVQLRGDLQPGLPSDVLTRRPDVRAAEHTLQAQNANIGAARAAFFPRISLTGSTGAASPDLGRLFDDHTGAWSFTPQISLPIFAGGANFANLHNADASRDVAVAQYEKAVQSAFRDVADALAVRATIEDRVAAQKRLVEAASVTQRLTQARYDAGVDSYLALLDAQRTLYAARQTLLAAELVESVNRVTLYTALGGGAPPAPRS